MKGIKFSIKPQTLITIIFVLVILLELFLLYTRVYVKMSPEADVVPNENIVRLDLTAFNRTMEFLDKVRAFVVEPWNINTPEPF